MHLQERSLSFWQVAKDCLEHSSEMYPQVWQADPSGRSSGMGSEHSNEIYP
jgi:hypothetical protein